MSHDERGGEDVRSLGTAGTLATLLPITYP